jgi:hypothetical protein
MQKLNAALGWTVIVSVKEDEYASVPRHPHSGCLNCSLNTPCTNDASARFPLRCWCAQVCNTKFGSYPVQQLGERADFTVALNYSGNGYRGVAGSHVS